MPIRKMIQEVDRSQILPPDHIQNLVAHVRPSIRSWTWSDRWHCCRPTPVVDRVAMPNEPTTRDHMHRSTLCSVANSCCSRNLLACLAYRTELSCRTIRMEPNADRNCSRNREVVTVATPAPASILAGCGLNVFPIQTAMHRIHVRSASNELTLKSMVAAPTLVHCSSRRCYRTTKRVLCS